MAFLAPDQAPGPMSRYCDGVQGPKKHRRAKPGSLKKSLKKFGLQPISLANSSQQGIQSTCKQEQRKITQYSEIQGEITDSLERRIYIRFPGGKQVAPNAEITETCFNHGPKLRAVINCSALLTQLTTLMLTIVHYEVYKHTVPFRE